MPTYEAAPEFLDQHARLTPEDKKRFRAAVQKLVEDLKSPDGKIRAGLRVKPYKSQQGVLEFTWAPDGRALFMYGEELKPGERHVVWLTIGTHDIFA